jgi:maleylpyruvate isomerase
MTPYEDLAAARAATSRLLDHLATLSVAGLAEPSLLPGWSRAHVVAHLTGNALSHVRMLDGCLAGDVRTQYADPEARGQGIAELAARPEAVVEAHAAAAAALEERWSAMRDEHWERAVRWLDRGVGPARTTVASREKEVEVHRVDLDAGYVPALWPGDVAERLLGRLLLRPDLPEMVLVSGRRRWGTSGPRISGSVAALAAWLAGRSDGRDLQLDAGRLPDLPAWS